MQLFCEKLQQIGLPIGSASFKYRYENKSTLLLGQSLEPTKSSINVEKWIFSSVFFSVWGIHRFNLNRVQISIILETTVRFPQIKQNLIFVRHTLSLSIIIKNLLYT